MPPPDGESAAHPGEKGLSIVRRGDAATFLRERIERPTRLGLWGMLGFGTITGSIGTTLYFIDRTPVAIAIAGFGGLLIVLGLVQQLLYRRDLDHWPDEAYLWDEGIELVLHNGDVRGVSWTDPDLALNLVARKAPAPAGREFLLVWMTEGKIPSIELTEDGFLEVQKAAVAQGLTVQQQRRGRKADATQNVEIRQSPARQLEAKAKKSDTEAGKPASGDS